MRGALKRKTMAVAVAVVTALLTVVVPAVVAPQAADAYACNPARDSFAGSVARMEHFLRCNHVPFQVYTQGSPVVATRSLAGGPSCQWQTRHIVQICSQRGVPRLECAQYWGGSYYPYHCGPIEAFNISHSQSLWNVVRHAFTSHAARACVRGTIGGATTAVILKVAAGSAGGPMGVMASMGGGCVAGIVSYFWKV